MSKSGVKAIIFDLDDTLLDRRATFEKYVPRFAERFASDLGECAREKLTETILEADGKGYRNRDEMAAMLRERLPWKEERAPEVARLVEIYREDFLACVCAAEGMREVLETVRARGIKTGIITNGLSVVQRRKIARLGIEDLIDVIVVSEEAGVKKPATEIYLRALKDLRAEAGETWFVGDHPENDILAPEELGMRGVWIEGMVEWPVDKPKPRWVIERLGELIGMIDNQNRGGTGIFSNRAG